MGQGDTVWLRWLGHGHFLCNVFWVKKAIKAAAPSNSPALGNPRPTFLPSPCPTLGQAGGKLRHELDPEPRDVPVALPLCPHVLFPRWQHSILWQSGVHGVRAVPSQGVLQPLRAPRVYLGLRQTQHEHGGNLCSHPVPKIHPLLSHIPSRTVPRAWHILPTSAPHTSSHQLPANPLATLFPVSVPSPSHGTPVTRSRR